MNKVKAWVVKDKDDANLLIKTIDEDKYPVERMCRSFNHKYGVDVFKVVPVLIEITEITNGQRS